MVAAGVTVHYLFAAVGALPTARPSLQEMVAFEIDYTFWLNVAFVVVGAALVWVHLRGSGKEEMSGPPSETASSSTEA